MEMFTVPEAADKVGCDASTLYLAVRNGKLKAERKYGVWLIPEAEIKEYKPRPRGRPRGLMPPNARLRTDISQSDLARELGISRQRVHQMFNKEAHNARTAVRDGLKTGKIVKPDRCERCMERTRLEAHHPDYAKQLEVLWLCAPCHSLVHPHHPSIKTGIKQARKASKHNGVEKGE